MNEETKYKVMIVDDDKFLVNMYELKFKKFGHDVSVSTSSVDALSKLKEGFDPDIMLIDVVMPSMDGLELLENIKKERLAKETVFVMLTNQGGNTDIEKAKSLGVHGYIVKATLIPSEVVSEVLKIAKDNKK